MQFSRIISSVDLQIWNATSNGFSFVISFESRNGSGLRGRPGFVASWRPIYQNRSAIKVGGSPFKTLAEAENACTTMLVHLIKRQRCNAAGIERPPSGGLFVCGPVRPRSRTEKQPAMERVKESL